MLSDIPQSRQWIKQTYPSRKWHQIPVGANKRDGEQNVRFTARPSIFKMPLCFKELFQSMEVTAVKWHRSFVDSFFLQRLNLFNLTAWYCNPFQEDELNISSNSICRNICKKPINSLCYKDIQIKRVWV